MKNTNESSVFQWLDELSFNRFHASALILGCLILCRAGFNLQILAYALPLISKQWALTPVQSGAMVSYGLFGLMTGALGFGIVADRIGRKKALLVAICSFSLFSGAASLAPNYLALCVLRFMTGAGIGRRFSTYGCPPHRILSRQNPGADSRRRSEWVHVRVGRGRLRLHGCHPRVRVAFAFSAGTSFAPSASRAPGALSGIHPFPGGKRTSPGSA